MSLYDLPFLPPFMKFLDCPSQIQDDKQIKLQKTKGNYKKKERNVFTLSLKLWKQLLKLTGYENSVGYCVRRCRTQCPGIAYSRWVEIARQEDRKVLLLSSSRSLRTELFHVVRFWDDSISFGNPGLVRSRLWKDPPSFFSVLEIPLKSGQKYRIS